MDIFTHRLKSDADHNHGAVWVLKNARFAVFCILLAMCFGVEMDDETVEKVDETMRNVLLVLVPRLDDYFPLLSPFFSEQRRRVQEVKKQKIVADPELVTLYSEFLNGGTDTTVTAIEWAVARMIENPEIQSRLYDEIRSTLGEKRVDEKDVENMPYLNAVVKELLRKHPPTYFLLTHAVTEPTKLGGYDIPPGTNVEFFSQGISDVPRVWSNPEKFDPDRFFKASERMRI
ncbi:hypothetical protein OROGR_031064 [Orobanche gracilis]